MIVLTSDLYTVRNLILNGRVQSMSLDEIDRLIEFNARSEFIDDFAFERVQEAKRNGTNREAEGSGQSLH